jgi:hypothetical protein
MSKPTFKAKPMQVQVPASSANLGPGFDSLCIALSMHDRYVAQVLDDVVLDIDVTGEGADEVPRNDKNLLVKAMYKGFDFLGGRPKGLAIRDYAFDVATDLGVPTIDFTEIYCDGSTCPLAIGGVRVYRDYRHITTVFGKTLGPFLYNNLVDIGFVPLN